MLVFVHHVDPDVAPGGYLGVTLFFSLSGYLITALLLAEHERVGRIDLRAFYMRRFLRLMPALAAMVGITVAASLVGFGYGHTLADAWPALLYIQDIVAPITHTLGGLYNHTWSLGVEEQFYLVWPTVLVLALRRQWRLPRLVVAMIGSSLALTIAVTLHPTSQRLADVYRAPFTHVPAMGLGILLAVASRSTLHERFRRLLSIEVLGAAMLAALLVATLTIREDSIVMYRGGYLVAGGAMTLLVGHLLVGRGRMVAAFSHPALVWLGQRSYGAYLWQAPVILLLAQHIRSPILLGLTSAVGTLVATVLSWRVVEKPFLRMKTRFEVRRAPAPESQATIGI